MGRHYGLKFAPVVGSAANGAPAVAPASLGSLFGSGLPSSSARLDVIDSAGQSRAATVLFSNTEQINFIVPEGAALGPARFDILDGDGAVQSSATGTIARSAPALFTAMGNGKGPAAALGLRLELDGSQSNVPVFRWLGPLCITERIEVSEDRPVHLSLYGTGIRGATSLSAVQVSIGSVSVPVLYAGPQEQFPGLDQVNVRLPASLRGGGEVDLTLTVDGTVANTVRIGIR